MTAQTTDAAKPGQSLSITAPTGLSDLMRSPWATSVDLFNEFQALYATYARSEKLDIAGFEKRTGLTLPPQRIETRVDRGVAVIQLDGMLTPKPTILGRIFGGTSTQWVTEQVNAAIRNPVVTGIILAIDSPGGSVFGTAELAATVFDAAQKKPIVTHSDGWLASAAYWIGAAANAVYMSGPTVQVGSIGVVMARTYDPEAAKDTTEIFAGRYKQYTSSHGAPTKEALAYLQTQVDYLYSVFVEAVATFRGVAPDHVAAHMAEGRMFIGSQAIDAGLVDGIISLGALVNAMASNPSAFAKRRRITGHRAIAAPAKGAAPSQLRAPVSQVNPPRILSGQEQADAAVAYSRQRGVDVVQALKTLGYAT